MKKNLFLILILLIVSALACANPFSQDQMQVAITETLGAQLAQTSAAVQATNTAEFERLGVVIETQNAQLTQAAQTPAVPLDSSPTVTPPPTLAEGESPAVALAIVISAQTACRQGPNLGFSSVETFEAGEVLPPAGRNEDSSWFAVALKNGSQCWVFDGENLEVTGLVSSIAVLQGPQLPTPTFGPTEEPGFFMGGRTVYTCDGREWISIGVTARGGVTFQWGRISVYNLTQSKELGSFDNNNFFFASATNCDPYGAETLASGNSAFAHLQISNVKIDDELRVNVRLCTEKNNKGECFVNVIITHK
jgi:hypothetical protein